MLKKLLKATAVCILASSMFSVTVQADALKGQKIIIKKLKKPCGFTGGVLAKKHTQDEWKSKFESNQLNDEILKICPKAKPLRDKYLKHVYDFLYNYASDSGNVPSC
ncbi:cytochrome C [Malaciobacter halophilus]|uniref:Cytochrome C n=1 Tax=Malaciobacter halophilus TaxID=197482 RepID=A0A2N1J1P7_9BACT|nr:cytochrome C [Malaciobacter halophilus]AXH08616.1 hypothetical protein AHALO_0205 [Malaciobacter halophilus]PKI80461.1 cytochrome C [Malaciobacter halophilus]